MFDFPAAAGAGFTFSGAVLAGGDGGGGPLAGLAWDYPGLSRFRRYPLNVVEHNIRIN
jgi:hypothetical protein